MSNRDSFDFNAVLHLKIPDADVSRFRSGRHTAILLEFDGTLVVLFKNIVLDLISLRLKEILDPNCIREIVAGPDKLGFGRTLRVQFLLGGFTEDPTTTK